MRFKLILEVDKHAFGNKIPINYQYEQSSVIYKILSNADDVYASWLHDNGFKLENNKTFKFFVYSRFKIDKYRILKSEERLQILSDTIEWHISFLPEISTEKFICGVFRNQVFEVGDLKSVVRFVVRGVEFMPEPDFLGRMTFRTMSPVCIKYNHPNGKTEYMSPVDYRSPFLLYNGIFDKYRAFFKKECPFNLSECKIGVIGEPKSALVRIKSGTSKEVNVRGYMCKFEVEAPVELVRLMYDGGVGSMNSQGFGYLDIAK